MGVGAFGFGGAAATFGFGFFGVSVWREDFFAGRERFSLSELPTGRIDVE